MNHKRHSQKEEPKMREFLSEVWKMKSRNCATCNSCHDDVAKQTPHQNVCPVDIELLRLQAPSSSPLDSNLKSICSDEEETTDFGSSTSDLKTWDKYRRLLVRGAGRLETDIKTQLTHVTSLERIHVGWRRVKSRPNAFSLAKRSIIKPELQRKILIVDRDYVKFPNFVSNKLYKKTITLRNVSNSPARLQIEGRPSHSKFVVMIEPTNSTGGIIPPGMKLRLIILFRSDSLDEPEELLVINVQNGKPVVVKLHGYKDPPILKGIDVTKELCSREESQEIQYMDDQSGESSFENCSSKRFANSTFDCQRGFVGELIHTVIKFKNYGGVGRFFIMNEIDWCSMHIEDITSRNTLVLSSFALWPAYFRLRPREEMLLHGYFFPNSPGVHVDKLFLACDNCSLTTVEIIGDGVAFEKDLIQINKQLHKNYQSDSKLDIDERAVYRLNLNLATADSRATIRDTISVKNISEMPMHFRWEKRDVASTSSKINRQNYFPTNSLEIYPRHGIFSPTSLHHFTVSAELEDPQSNLYLTVLQLFVEDIPLAAIPEDVETESCRQKRRKCSSSVDVWIADIQVSLRIFTEDSDWSLEDFEQTRESTSRISLRESQEKLTNRLGIKDSKESLYLTMYFPVKNATTSKEDFVRVEWHTDSLMVALDLSGKCKENFPKNYCSNILEKYEKPEEIELMNWDLDDYDSFLDLPMQESLEKKMEKREHLSSLRKPVVVEFFNLPLKTVKRKMFIVKNESSISSRFWLTVKNFYPRECACTGRSRAESMKSGLVDETLSRLKQPKSGILICVDPSKSELGPFQSVTINIYVLADTWGLYTDELEINVEGLPRYTLGIRVDVVGSPISFPIFAGFGSTKSWTLRFGTIRKGTRAPSRNLLLKNTSVLPVAITWHTFLVDETLNSSTELPFNVVLDIFTPFTNELATILRKKTGSNRPVKNLKNPLPKIEAKKKVGDTDTLYDSNDRHSSKLTVAKSKSKFKARRTLNCEKFFASTDESNKMYENKRREQEPEFEIAITPYYGQAETKACLVYPREVFVPPKSTVDAMISLKPENLDPPADREAEIRFKLLGFLRISAADKYKDYYHVRKDGQYLAPIEIDVEARTILPRLSYEISRSDRTFTFLASKVMQRRKKILQKRRTFFFHNRESDTIQVSLETNDPFCIESVWVYAETDQCTTVDSVCITGHGCAEVEISCTVDQELIQHLMATNRDAADSMITFAETLSIGHSDNCSQEMDLILKLVLPTISLSSHSLNFGTVYVDDAKKLLLIIRNSDCNEKLSVKSKLKNDEFSFVHEEKSRSLTIAFRPRKVGPSTEILEISSNLPNIVQECLLQGEGSLDEKYHVPGL